GGVIMSDWSDSGECHDYIDIHRENGRIYKITYGTPAAVPVNLAQFSDAQLVKLQLHKNDWFVTQSRLLLQERAAAGKLDARTRPALLSLLREQSDVTRQLRALWALHVTGGLDEKLALELLDNPQEWLRAWTIQLALEKSGPGVPRGRASLPINPSHGSSSASGSKTNTRLLKFLVKLAAKDPSPVVGLYLASALQRLSPAERLPIAAALVTRGDDASDANLPLMIWYGIEPIASTEDKASAVLLGKAQIPLVRQFIAQRLALRLSLDTIASALNLSENREIQRDAVRGLFDALNGRRAIRMPADWPALAEKLNQHPDASVQEEALLLSLVFGDPAAEARLRERVTDTNANPAIRRNA